MHGFFRISIHLHVGKTAAPVLAKEENVLRISEHPRRRRPCKWRTCPPSINFPVSHRKTTALWLAAPLTRGCPGKQHLWRSRAIGGERLPKAPSRCRACPSGWAVLSSTLPFTTEQQQMFGLTSADPDWPQNGKLHGRFPFLHRPAADPRGCRAGETSQRGARRRSMKAVRTGGVPMAIAAGATLLVSDKSEAGTPAKA